MRPEKMALFNAKLNISFMFDEHPKTMFKNFE